jgi:hypothetical protein
MKPIRVGVVADPASPTQVARRLTDLDPPGGDAAWDIEIVSEPFTIDSEDVDTALRRLGDHARQHDWDLVVGLTELPLRDDDGRYLLAKTDPQGRTAVLSLPALGGLRVYARTRRAVRALVSGMADATSADHQHLPLPRLGGRWRLLLGMVLANRPWLLVPGLKSALVAALATGAVATINATVWLLAGSMSPWRLLVATIASIALVVAWLVIDGELWDRPDDDSAEARERSRLYNVSTLVTLTTGVLIAYLALYAVNLAWALFVLDPAVMGSYLNASRGYGDLFVLAWFVASAATVGGGLGTGLESDESIRAAAYSKREEERRHRLARDRTWTPARELSISAWTVAHSPRPHPRSAGPWSTCTPSDALGRVSRPRPCRTDGGRQGSPPAVRGCPHRRAGQVRSSSRPCRRPDASDTRLMLLVVAPRTVAAPFDAHSCRYPRGPDPTAGPTRWGRTRQTPRGGCRPYSSPCRVLVEHHELRRLFDQGHLRVARDREG